MSRSCKHLTSRVWFLVHLIDEIVNGGVWVKRHDLMIFWEGVAEQLVENVIISLDWQLESNSRFLQKISFHVGPRDLPIGFEMNSNELAKSV